MNRREFLMWVGIGGLASSLPVALTACSPKTEKSESFFRIALSGELASSNVE